MKHTFPIFLVTLFLAGCANTSVVPALKKNSDFVPPHFFVLKQADGDLNGDGLDDTAFVAAHEIENSTDPNLHSEDVPDRELHVLLQNTDGSYYEVASSTNSIMCRTCDDAAIDPLQSLIIYNGALDIGQYRGDSTRRGVVMRFKWLKDALYLVEKKLVTEDLNFGINTAIDYNFASSTITFSTTTETDGEPAQRSAAQSAALRAARVGTRQEMLVSQPLQKLQDFSL